MNFWWVNHNQTYKQERDGQYLWAPTINKIGREVPHWQTMLRVQPGDLIFSHVDGEIRHLGFARTHAYDSLKPEFDVKAAESWEEQGRRVDLEFHELSLRVKPKDKLHLIAPLLPKKHSPIQENGKGNQGYLYEISSELGSLLIELIGDQAHEVAADCRDEVLREVDSEEVERSILKDTSLRGWEREQLVKARRGQGLFKTRLLSIERRCRLTGVTNPSRLIASHIKPWAKSSNAEKVDGHNGLLLSPHVDHLFDRGLISFTDTGEMLVSNHIDAGLLGAWKIEQADSHSFSPEQASYLKYHRSDVFKG